MTVCIAGVSEELTEAWKKGMDDLVGVYTVKTVIPWHAKLEEEPQELKPDLPDQVAEAVESGVLHQQEEAVQPGEHIKKHRTLHWKLYKGAAPNVEQRDEDHEKGGAGVQTEDKHDEDHEKGGAGVQTEDWYDNEQKRSVARDDGEQERVGAEMLLLQRSCRYNPHNPKGKGHGSKGLKSLKGMKGWKKNNIPVVPGSFVQPGPMQGSGQSSGSHDAA
jgi:hypothetical protein